MFSFEWRKTFYNGTCKKTCITKEYNNRINKIWISEFSSFNKTGFVVLVLRSKFELLAWMIDEIQSINVKTKKILTNTLNFHTNSDVISPYLKQKQGGRGLTSIHTACRIIIYLGKSFNYQTSKCIPRPSCNRWSWQHHEAWKAARWTTCLAWWHKIMPKEVTHTAAYRQKKE